jgi:hypothetical protein
MDGLLSQTAAEVLTILGPTQLMKIDFKGALFQIPVHTSYWRCYGIS